MFLNRLVLKGFKSFAEATEIELEPGVTVIVGPNGSGKSNIVDAVAWVLGAQGPRSLRGDTMEDVIFAGTSNRSQLGRAEVSLTIDNSSRQIPIDFTEVTITRVLFRNGASEYQINSTPCRLLDIQELLSDSGIGRQQHVIVGQGRLDRVLNAEPGERRGIIEEAAGILKFRKRKEKAERRLEGTEANVLRLNDLVREVRRQLKPLEKQADAARRHGSVRQEIEDLKIHLAAKRFISLTKKLEISQASSHQALAGVKESEFKLGVIDEQIGQSETALSIPTDDDLEEVVVRVETQKEKAKGLIVLAHERTKAVLAELQSTADSGVVDSLVADAEQLRFQIAEIPDSSETSGDLELTQAEEHLEEIQTEIAGLVEARPKLLDESDRSAQQLEKANQELEQVRGEYQTWNARLETLRRSPGVGPAVEANDALREAGFAAQNLRAELEIKKGYELAVEAALGDLLHGSLVRSERVNEAFGLLAKKGLGGVLALGPQLEAGSKSDKPPIPSARPLAEFVSTASPDLQSSLAYQLTNVYVADQGEVRPELFDKSQGLKIVTKEGHLFTATSWTLRSAEIIGLEDFREAAEKVEVARESVEEIEAQVEQLRSQLADQRTALDEMDQRANELNNARLTETQRVARLQSDLAAHQASAQERKETLEKMLSEVDERLASRPGEEASAQAKREEIHQRETELGKVAARAQEAYEQLSALAERLHRVLRFRADQARHAGKQLEDLRKQRRETEEVLAEQRALAQTSELEASETRLRTEALEEEIRTEFDREPGAILDLPAPDLTEGVNASSRVKELERELRLMGQINPLALTEYEALSERFEFLQSQLDDVKASRKELRQVIREVNREILERFDQAFADVDKYFGELFGTLFPGGSARLVLTDAEDPLSSGVEIEARPSGKKLGNLSLLSGGERSLSALAYLFAVFKARPSPFYILDEVEAALDDLNLQRFVDLVSEFAKDAQLVIVSHQRRTMEAADVLYGVSMPPGGQSHVVSQRLGELEERFAPDPT